MILAEATTRFAGTSDSLTEKVIGEAMYVHRTLGPGFLESVYQNALVLRLHRQEINVQVQHPLSVLFDGAIVGEFFADILVEGGLILELKSVAALTRAHESQLVNYLTATGIEVGLLLNFGAKSLEVKRKTRTLPRPAAGLRNHSNPVNPV
jgi:GxxExxY protein